MNAILAVGHAIARQTWYLLVAYVGYVLLLALLDHGQADKNDLVATNITFLIAICALLPLSGLPNEIRSRRIVFVLSKGVSRKQYFAGVAYGHLLLSALASCAGVAAARRLTADTLAAAFVLSLLLVSAGMLGVVSLGSRFAPIVPAAVFLLPRVSMWLAGRTAIVPHDVVYSSLIVGSRSSAAMLLLTCAEAALLFAVALFLFERDDIAAPVE
jgi:hypothetical protein